jgi:MFS family permease
MPKFTAVLKNRNFFLLWLGQIISQVGDRLGFMALIGFAYSKRDYGSPSEIFKILLFTIIPVFLIGPIAGVYVDRWDRRRTMFISDFLRMILVCLIPVFLFHIKNLAVAYILIFMVFCIARFFLPAKLAIVPDLVSREQLLIANSLVNVTGMIAFIVGSGISGVLVQRIGPENSFYIDGLSFMVSGLLIYFIVKKASSQVNLRKIGEDIVEVIKKSAVQEIKEGLKYFVRKKDIWATAAILFVVASALGVVSVVSIVFVQNTLQSATEDLGLLIMFLGAGLFVGSLIYGKFGARISHYKMIFSSLILSGLMLIVFALGIHYYPYFAPAALLAFCLGFIASPILIASNTIIHKSSDNEMRGKVFSSLEIVMHLGFLLFMYVSSILAERFSHTLILVIIGCVFAAVGIFNLIYYRRIPWLEKI